MYLKFFKHFTGTWSQFIKGQALRREGNKVDVLEGTFHSLKFFFVPKKKTSFYMSHVSNQNDRAPYFILHVFAYCSE